MCHLKPSHVPLETFPLLEKTYKEHIFVVTKNSITVVYICQTEIVTKKVLEGREFCLAGLHYIKEKVSLP